MTKHKWKNTPGPIKIMVETPDKTHIEAVDQSANGHAAIALTYGPERNGNARLLAASYNAFDTAATRLGLNAVELAERMQDGGLFDLVWALSTLGAAHALGKSPQEQKDCPELVEAQRVVKLVRGRA